MKHIVCPFPVRHNLRLLGAIVALLVLGTTGTSPGAAASTRPKKGGTLRVEIIERVATIDPRQIPMASAQASVAERVAALVFDRFVRFDEHGAVQPALAISWEHDAQFKRWQFRLRDGVKFSDGTPLTPPVAALALQQLLGGTLDVSASPDSVIIQSDHSLPDFLSQLSAGRYFIFYTAADNSLVGTGPFRVSEWAAAAGGTGQSVFLANESCWAGRPFVDKIELLMGVDYPQQANAISFGRADVVELPASQVRRAGQRGVRTVSSDPVEVFVLVLDASRPTLQDSRVRQAISLAIDRASIADVILQRQGTVAGGLLPNWISGYAHLFPATSDLPRAKDLLLSLGREISRPLPLVMFYDSSDAEAHEVADRVAVNLREVGIMVQVSGQIVDEKSKFAVADLRLQRLRISSPDPAPALSELLNELGEPATALETPEQIYAAERAPIDAFRVIPLVHVSESYGLSAQVRDWMPPRWGGWRLEDVWLGPSTDAGGNSR